MKTATNFRATFNRVRRELGKTSGFGFSISDNPKILEQRFRDALAVAGITATRQRMELVSNWIGRATMMGVAA